MNPQLNGLILVGGKSRRMQEDKGLMNLHGKPQRLYTWDLLKQAGLENAYFSCREDQQEELNGYETIIDSPDFDGPPDVILNVLTQFPDNAWLITACDLPLLTVETLEELIHSRNSDKIATVFQLPDRNFPEPLIAIWEPSAGDKLKEYFASGQRKLIKFLMESEVEVIEPSSPQSLYNMNDPVAREYVQRVIAGK